MQRKQAMLAAEMDRRKAETKGIDDAKRERMQKELKAIEDVHKGTSQKTATMLANKNQAAQDRKKQHADWEAEKARFAAKRQQNNLMEKQRQEAFNVERQREVDSRASRRSDNCAAKRAEIRDTKLNILHANEARQAQRNRMSAEKRESYRNDREKRGAEALRMQQKQNELHEQNSFIKLEEDKKARAENAIKLQRMREMKDHQQNTKLTDHISGFSKNSPRTDARISKARFSQAQMENKGAHVDESRRTSRYYRPKSTDSVSSLIHNSNYDWSKSAYSH